MIEIQNQYIVDKIWIINDKISKNLYGVSLAQRPKPKKLLLNTSNIPDNLIKLTNVMNVGICKSCNKRITLEYLTEKPNEFDMAGNFPTSQDQSAGKGKK